MRIERDSSVHKILGKVEIFTNKQIVNLNKIFLRAGIFSHYIHVSLSNLGKFIKHGFDLRCNLI